MLDVGPILRQETEQQTEKTLITIKPIQWDAFAVRCRFVLCFLMLFLGGGIQMFALASGATAQQAGYGLVPWRAITEYALGPSQKQEYLSQESVRAAASMEGIRRPELHEGGLFLVVSGVVVVVLLGIMLRVCRRYHRRTLATARLQAELTKAQLQAMKAQLHPHFLFNTLNTISVLITENPVKANRMIVLLSDLLRQTLEASQADEVTLRRELELLRAYLEIQRMRFRRRLSVSYDVNADILDARLPNFTLQPIVENAIRHGVAKQRRGGRVDIRARRVNGSLVLQVQDNGPGVSLEKIRERNGNGIGLANTSKRLSCIYGRLSSFKIERRHPNGTIATIVIPYHESGKQS